MGAKVVFNMKIGDEKVKFYIYHDDRIVNNYRPGYNFYLLLCD